MFSLKARFKEYKSQETFVNTDQGQQLQNWQVEGNMDGVIRIGRDFTGAIAVGERGTRLRGNLTSLGVSIDGGPKQTLSCHHRLSVIDERPIAVQFHTHQLQLITQRHGQQVYNRFDVSPVSWGQETDIE